MKSHKLFLTIQHVIKYIMKVDLKNINYKLHSALKNLMI